MKITQPMIAAFLIGLIAGAIVLGFVDSYLHKMTTTQGISSKLTIPTDAKENFKQAKSIKQR